MSAIHKLIISILLIFWGGHSFSQRAHEIQVQYGFYINTGAGLYDYYITESSEKHSYEFEQKYTANIFNFSWHYPINGYLELGLFFSTSIDGTLNMVQQESVAINLNNGSSLRPDTLFVGSADLQSKFQYQGYVASI